MRDMSGRAPGRNCEPVVDSRDGTARESISAESSELGCRATEGAVRRRPSREETLPREPVARSSRMPLVGQADVLEGGQPVIRLLRPLMVVTSVHVFTCWHPTRNAARVSQVGPGVPSVDSPQASNNFLACAPPDGEPIFRDSSPRARPALLRPRQLVGGEVI